MKKWIALFMSVMLMLCLFSGCAGSDSKETEPALTYAGKTVTFIGDSITYGIGLENLTNQYWLHLQNNLALGMVQNKGVSGSCVSTQGTRGFEQAQDGTRKW